MRPLFFPRVKTGSSVLVTNIPLKAKEFYMCPPLFGSVQRRRNMDFGFDFKSNGNDLEFLGTTGLNPGFANPQVEIYQFSIGYNEVWQHPEGVSQFDIRGFYSPGGLSNHNSDLTFGLARHLSEANYAYATFGFEHQHRLINDWSMRAKIVAQAADGNLQASEQLGAGGFDIVRGFDQRIISGDEGFWTTLELYTPETSLGRIFDWKYSTDTLKFLAFLDAAAIGRITPNPAVPELDSQSIASVGVGMRWNYNDFFRLRIDYGYPIKTHIDPNRFPPVDESGRFHIGATATF